MSYLSEVSEGGFWLKSWLLISDYVDGRDDDDVDVDDHDGDDGDDDGRNGDDVDVDGDDDELFEWSGWLRLFFRLFTTLTISFQQILATGQNYISLQGTSFQIFKHIMFLFTSFMLQRKTALRCIELFFSSSNICKLHFRCTVMVCNHDST